MLKQKTISIFIVICFLVGLYGAGVLVWREIQQPGSCPQLFGIPACFIVFICFLIPFVVHIWNKLTIFYFMFAGMAWGLALIASYLEWQNPPLCPRMFQVPTCYFSLLLFSLLIGLKIYLIHTKRIKRKNAK